MDFILAAVAGYLIGSIPFSVLIAKAFGLADPRSYGSGNPGATNVLRSGNKLAGRLVFAADALKGLLPAIISALILDGAAAAICAGLAVVGHVYSPWLKFKGGRGVATGFGALIILHWPSALIAFAVWLALYFSTKTVSVASVASFTAAALSSFFLVEGNIVASAVIPGISFLVILRHRDNLKKFLAGKEQSFEKQKNEAQKAAATSSPDEPKGQEK